MKKLLYLKVRVMYRFSKIHCCFTSQGTGSSFVNKGDIVFMQISFKSILSKQLSIYSYKVYEK